MTPDPTPPTDAEGADTPTIRVNVPPDHTPEEEEALVAAVAAAYEASHGTADVNIEVDRPEEVDYSRVSERASQRWNA